VEEKAVASEAIGLALDRAVGDAELARDLAQPGAAQETVEDGPGKVAALEPVGRGEGL
jgi:hypothetical protein